MLALQTLVALVALADPTDTPGAGALGVLAVAPAPGPGTELVELAIQLRQVVAEAHPGALDARQLRERMTGPPQGAALAELDRAYEGARAAYLRSDFEGSLRTLRAIVADLERLPDGPERFGQWTRAMTRLARSELDLGREASARGVVERLLRAAPDIEIDRSLYPSRLLGLIESVRAALAASPQRALAVTSSTEGARVYVDGRDAGTAPLTLRLARGRYRVSGAKGNLAVPSSVVDLTERDQESFLDFAIPESLRPSQGPGLALPEGDRARGIVEAGGYLGLDQVLAVSLSREGGVAHVAGALYDVRRGMLVREGQVRLSNLAIPAGGASALATFLVTGETTSRLVEYRGGPPPETPVAPPAAEAAKALAPPPAPRPAIQLGEGPLGWTALGTGVAALGLVTYGVVQTRSANLSYRRADDLRRSGGVGSTAALATYDGYIADGDAARRRASIGWAGAGAGALATGILGYLNYRRTGEIGPFRF